MRLEAEFAAELFASEVDDVPVVGVSCPVEMVCTGAEEEDRESRCLDRTRGLVKPERETDIFLDEYGERSGLDGDDEMLANPAFPRCCKSAKICAYTGEWDLLTDSDDNAAAAERTSADRLEEDNCCVDGNRLVTFIGPDLPMTRFEPPPPLSPPILIGEGADACLTSSPDNPPSSPNFRVALVMVRLPILMPP